MISEKIDVIYRAHQGFRQKFALIGGGALLSILAMPAALVAATLYQSALLGAKFFRHCDPKRLSSSWSIIELNRTPSKEDFFCQDASNSPATNPNEKLTKLLSLVQRPRSPLFTEKYDVSTQTDPQDLMGSFSLLP